MCNVGQEPMGSTVLPKRRRKGSRAKVQAGQRDGHSDLGPCDLQVSVLSPPHGTERPR